MATPYGERGWNGVDSFCSLIQRDSNNSIWLSPNGPLGHVIDQTKNTGSLHTAGIDFAANYRTDLSVIGWDGGLLPEPYETDTLLIAPGERYDVLVELAGAAQGAAGHAGGEGGLHLGLVAHVAPRRAVTQRARRR